MTGAEGEAAPLHGCNTAPKFKLTAYGVHIIRKDDGAKSSSVWADPKHGVEENQKNLRADASEGGFKNTTYPGEHMIAKRAESSPP